MRFYFVTPITIRQPFASFVINCARYICVSSMEGPGVSPSSVVVKESIPSALFSQATHEASELLNSGAPSADGKLSSTTVPTEMQGVTAEAAAASLRSALGILADPSESKKAQPTRTALTVTRSPCKDMPYGPPVFPGFQSRGTGIKGPTASVVDVSLEDPAIVGWSFEQKGRPSELEGSDAVGDNLEMLKATVPGVPVTLGGPPADPDVESQDAESSSQDASHAAEEPRGTRGMRDAAPQERARGDRTVGTGESSRDEDETSIPATSETRKRKRKRRKRVAKKRSTGSRDAEPQTVDREAKESERSEARRRKVSEKLGIAESCEETDEDEDGSSLLAHLPVAAVSSSESEGEDGVYSLKPLFAGALGAAAKQFKARKKGHGESSDKCRRPNYFVSIQTNSIEIHRSAKKVLDHIRSCEPAISKACIAIPTLHVTLLVLRVEDGDDSLERAKEALVRSYELVKDDLNTNPLVLEFKGLGHFGNEVLFAKLNGEQAHARLQKVADTCLGEFAGANLDLSGHKAFKPHLTLVKLSKSSPRKKGIRKIKKEWYEEYAEETFGRHTVSSLQLSSMTKPKDEDGYYYCSKECRFESVPEEEADHGECCRPAPPSPSEASPGSPQRARRRLLELESAKEEVKRTISTLTRAKLEEMGSITVGERGDNEPYTAPEPNRESETADGAADHVIAGGSGPAEAQPEVTCSAPLPNCS